MYRCVSLPAMPPHRHSHHHSHTSHTKDEPPSPTDPHTLIKRARKKLRSTSLLHIALANVDEAMDRYEEAARILVRASELFEDKEEWRNAGGCYEEASHVLEQNLRTLSDERRRYMTTLLVKASLCYGECPNGNQEARGCLQRAINILEEKGLMDDVGFYLVQVGDLYGEQSMWTQAESVYRRAYHVFEDQERVEESEMVTARLAEVVCRGGGDPVEVCDQFVVEHIGMDKDRTEPSRPSSPRAPRARGGSPPPSNSAWPRTSATRRLSFSGASPTSDASPRRALTPRRGPTRRATMSPSWPQCRRGPLSLR